MAKTADGNVFTDLSGASTATSGNPYNIMLEACSQDPFQIQQRYKKHREARNEQQKAKLLSPDFSGFIVDPVLEKLIRKVSNPGYVDPRNCLVFWGRPPVSIRKLVNDVQQQLLKVAPSVSPLTLYNTGSLTTSIALWLMPLGKLHLTVLEMTHSKTPEEISTMADTMQAQIPAICDYTYDHRCRLVKPALGYDGAAIALSFLPAATIPEKDAYTYHHLRRDLYEICESTGTKVASRYVLPSAHLTIARFVNQDLYEEGRMGKLVEELEAINVMLRDTTWGGKENEAAGGSVQWIVGEEKGLVCRRDTVWYGDGKSQYEGRGFTRSI